MKKSFIVLALFAPAVLSAQSSSASANSSASASVEVRRESRDSGEYRAPSRFSAATRARLEASVSNARSRGLPHRPLIARITEAEAKGATDAQVVAATSRMSAQLQASHDAMVRAGRHHPGGEETTQGAWAIARGYTSANIEAVTRSAPSDRSLVVAFSTLTDLQARGVPVTRAVAEVRSRLEARASDATIASLGTTLAADGAVNAGRGSRGVAAGAGTAAGAAVGAGNGVSAAAGAAGGIGAAAGGVAGSVGAVAGVKKP